MAYDKKKKLQQIMDIKSLQDNNKIRYFLLKFTQFSYSAVSHMNQNAGQYDKCMEKFLTIN